MLGLMLGALADEVLGAVKANAATAMIEYEKRNRVRMNNFAGRGHGKIITFFNWVSGGIALAILDLVSRQKSSTLPK